MQQFTSLCYHYIRTKNNQFPRILGNDIDEFIDHIKMLQKKYSIISANDVLNFYYNNQSFKNNKNILITFDDGLSDHFEAAKILHENDIKAMFFVPTCILDEKLPANPMIIHYCIAEFGITNFLGTFYDIIEELKVSNNIDFSINHFNEFNNRWDKISQIKNMFKYKIQYSLSRKILIKIFQKLFLEKYPNGLDIIHLNENKIRDMIKMGHTIGTHTHTHLSIGATKLNSNDFKKEVINPKKILEKRFDLEIFSFSYPFGEKQDCLSSAELLKNTKEYKIAFTVEENKNTKKTSPLLLGRYMPTSKDSAKKLSLKIEKIFNS
ncbi:hypothetical protein NADRNF5_2108 [Nitrosopumilus adriaticus]|uniref:NodB homology domain-containing protein n=2 Tax=Nitrosopumilus adriaticus TaxID=1580092 RepID=A0A0D5C4X4_9ARCH|nr:hypothetical protein NADRNF5_2108 [Nitrosopumilus adriaticus]